MATSAVDFETIYALPVAQGGCEWRPAFPLALPHSAVPPVPIQTLNHRHQDHLVNAYSRHDSSSWSQFAVYVMRTTTAAACLECPGLQWMPLTWLAGLQQQTVQNKQCFGAVMAARCKLLVPSHGDHSSAKGCCRARQGQSCYTAAQGCTARVAPAPLPPRCLTCPNHRRRRVHNVPQVSSTLHAKVTKATAVRDSEKSSFLNECVCVTSAYPFSGSSGRRTAVFWPLGSSTGRLRHTYSLLTREVLFHDGDSSQMMADELSDIVFARATST